MTPSRRVAAAIVPILLAAAVLPPLRLFAQQGEDAPRLSIEIVEEGAIRLSWPTEAPDFRLERSTDISSDVFWEEVGIEPTIAGDRFSIDLEAFQRAIFFRLLFDSEPPNEPPTLEAIGNQTVALGSALRLTLSAADLEDDALVFGVQPNPLPRNASFDAETGVFTFRPDGTQARTFEFIFSVSDGTSVVMRAITVSVPAPALEGATTLAGRLLDTNAMQESGAELPIVGANVALLGSGSSAVSGPDGRFLIDPAVAGEQVIAIDPTAAEPGPGGASYPRFREKFPIIENAANIIERPILLPRLASASMTTIDPNATTVVSNAAIQVSLSVPAGSAKGEDGENFAGELSISPVPPNLAPMGLPPQLQPGVLVTIQPVGVRFDTPAPITFPNTDNLAPGSRVDIWSLDPDTGQFAIVGEGEATPDGQSIATISGGVRAADWHFPVPPPPPDPSSDPNGNDPDNQDPDNQCQTAAGSLVAQASGSLSSEFELPPYWSLGANRALRFVYETERAYPHPIVAAHLENPLASAVPELISYRLALAGVELGRETFIDSSGFDEDEDEPYRVAAGGGASGFQTGTYDYRLRVTNHFEASSVSNDIEGHVNIVNFRDSPFGAGWGLAGLQRLRVTEDGSILLVDGDGGNLFFRNPESPDLVVRNLDGDALLRFDGETGELIGEFVRNGDGGLSEAGKPRFGPDGNLYVMSGDEADRSVKRYDGQTGAFIDTFISPGSGGLDSLVDFAVGPDGNFYVTNVSNNKVLRYSGADGSFLGVAAEGQGMIRACAVQFDSDGLLNVMDTDFLNNTEFDRVLRFEGSTGAFIDEIVPGGPMRDVCWYFIAEDNRMFVADGPTLRSVHLFDSEDRSYLGRFVDFGVSGLPGLPFYAEIGPDGMLYVGQGGADFGILRFDGETGEFVDKFIAGTTGAPTWTPGTLGQHRSPPGDSSRLTKAEDGGYLRTLADGAVYRFDSEGLLVSVTDRNGNETLFEYDASDRLVRIVEPTGGATTFSYETGHLSSVVDPSGRETQFAHGSAGDLLKVRFPNGKSRFFDYDNRHLMTREIDERGFVTTRVFDATGRFERSTQPDQSARQSTNVQTIAFVPPNSVSGTRENPSEAIRPEDAVSSFTDGAGVTSRLQTGAFGELRVLTDPAGLQWEYDSDSFGNPTRVALPWGQVETAIFDAQGNQLTANVETLGGESRFFYESFSQRPTTFIDPAGNTTRFEYDRGGNLTAIEMPSGIRDTFAYSESGLIEAMTIRGGRATSIDYDGNGRATAVIFGAGEDARQYGFAHSDAGYLTEFTTSLGNTFRRSYDSMGNLSSVETPSGAVTRYAYDAVGNRAAVVMPNRSEHRYVYDSNGQMVSYSPPDVGIGDASTSFQYNDGRQLAVIDRPDGKTIRFSYDDIARPTTISLERGDHLVVYDTETGLPSATTSPDGSVVTYQNQGERLSAMTWSGITEGAVSLAYDAFGRLSETRINGANAVAYQYNEDGLMTKAGELSIERDPDSGLVTAATLGATRSTWSYNAHLEVQRFEALVDDNPVLAIDYSYNDAGLVTKIDETIEGESKIYVYAYDSSGRLIEAREDGNLVETYSYDLNGNRSTGPQATLTYSHDAQDRLLAAGPRSFSYTANGELSSWTENAMTTSLEYDELGNLLSVSLPDGSTIAYAVDGENRRVEKSVDGVPALRFLYQDRLKVEATLDANNAIDARFAHALSETTPEYFVRGGTMYRVVADHLGSPRLIIDATSGQIVQRIDYDAFGRVTSDTNPGFQPFGFGGGLYDPDTGLVRFGARDYAAELGRWTTKDPMGQPTFSENRYAYALNDPVNFVDRLGLKGTTAQSGFAAMISEAAGQLSNVPGIGPAVSKMIEFPFDVQNAQNAAETATPDLTEAFKRYLEWLKKQKQKKKNNSNNGSGSDGANGNNGSQSNPPQTQPPPYQPMPTHQIDVNPLTNHTNPNAGSFSNLF